jgi:glyoxylase-like metal-dependent hydrolase (beta-lactamase superfamily II)
MSVFRVGTAKITRVEETYGATYAATDIFPECSGAVVSEHRQWLAPSHFDADTGFIKLSVHSWLLQIGKQSVEVGRADLVSGTHRLNDNLELMPAPGHSAGHVVFKLEAGGERALFIGDVFHHLLQVYYPDWNFPKNSDAQQARASRRMVLEHAASSGALVLPAHVGAPFAGRVETTGLGFRPRF